MELDNIICNPISSPMALSDVSECKVTPETVDTLAKLKKLGHTIVIYTERDVSLCMETETWLQKNKVPYDYVILNKLKYDVFIDSNVHKFNGWNEFIKMYK